MYLQLLVCFITLLFYIWYSSGTYARLGNEYLKNPQSYINIIIFLLILQSALRNIAVGADTYAYYVKYSKLTNESWGALFDAFPKAYVEGIGKDPGYSVICKLVQLISKNYQIFLFVVATFFFTGLAKMFKFMNLNLVGVCLAVLVYEVLFYGFFSITGIRQTIATGFFFYAYPFIQKKKIVPYILIMTVAATIHKSSLILLPFYFLANFKYPKQLLICVLIVLPFIFGIARTFAIYITHFQLFESYSGYAFSTYETHGAINFTIFIIIIAIFTIIATNKDGVKISQHIRVCINGLSLAIVFVPLTWVDPSFMRICQYFSVFSMFLLGPVIQNYCIKHKINVQYFILFIFLIFVTVIIKRGADYAFFWQHMVLPSNYRNVVI